jgi:hypothetical protein
VPGQPESSKNGEGQGQQVKVEDLEWSELARTAPSGELDVVAALGAGFVRLVEERVQPGSRVGVAVGSRGIARVAEVVAAAVQVLKDRGAQPVLVPAMGSHGGASAEGQAEVLRELGVYGEALGAAVDASMDVEEIGALSSGQPVYLAKSALGCDAVVPVNRVKPHSDFRAPIESGLTKMLTIGLGKERGASSLHSVGFENFAQMLPEAAGVVLGVLRVPFGLALLEDAWHRLRRVEVVPGEDLLERDRELLLDAWANFPRLPFPEVDVLVLREIGKMISGSGMDPNVTGRFAGKAVPAVTTVERLAVLDLAHNSGGNAIGVGVADVVTERLRAKVDWSATYANAIASKSLAGARLPVVVGNDLEALTLAAGTLTGASTGPPRVVAMVNTLDVNHIAVSAPLVEVATAAGYSPMGSRRRAEFGRDGSLLRIGGIEFFPNDR